MMRHPFPPVEVVHRHYLVTFTDGSEDTFTAGDLAGARWVAGQVHRHRVVESVTFLHAEVFVA